jgi:hypothetical protein
VYIKNKWLKIGFRLLLVGLCLWGILLNVLSAGNWSEILSYYTIQSNLIIMLFFVGLIIYTLLRHNQPLPPNYYTIKGTVMMCIILTLLIFHFLLRPTLFSMGAGDYVNSPMNLLVHYVVPLMTIADWLLFDRKGAFRKFDPLFWTIIPWAYLGFSLIRAQFATFSNSGSHYPYFFIDIDALGVGQVIINVIIIAIGYVALGYIIYFIDFGLSKIKWRAHSALPAKEEK